MSGSDAETGSLPSPKPISAASTGDDTQARKLAVPRDSRLDALLKAQKDKRDRAQTARAEANTQRRAAMDGASKPPRGAPRPARRTTSVPCKPVGSITWFVEGASAYEDVAMPTTSFLLKLKDQGFGVVAVDQKGLEIPRNMTHGDCLDFLEANLPIPYQATVAAIEAWKDAHPSYRTADVPPFFRILAQEGKRLKLVGTMQPTGADLQAVITSASNWYDKKLFITSGLDISMYTEDEVALYRPCMLKTLLDGNASPAPESEEAEDDEEYEAPISSKKRKRSVSEASEPEPPVTRSKRKKDASPPVDLTQSDDEAPKAGPSGAQPTLGTTTMHLTGFQSPPKRVRKRAAYCP